MFGANEIVGKKYFKDADGKLFVTSMFYTLQGEGPYAGVPSIFVRLTKCNLACDFCDTYFDSGEWYTVDDVLARIQKEVIDKHFKGETPEWAKPGYPGGRQMVLVVTGGEPTLQNDALYDLLTRASTEFEYTQIETNGIIAPKVAPSTTVVCSPKCVNDKYTKPHPDLFYHRDLYFKFVVEKRDGSPYGSVPDWAMDHRGRVYISPMNTYLRHPDSKEIASFWTPGLLDLERNKRNHEYCATYCVKHGFRLNLQMHLYASLE